MTRKKIVTTTRSERAMIGWLAYKAMRDRLGVINVALKMYDIPCSVYYRSPKQLTWQYPYNQPKTRKPYSYSAQWWKGDASFEEKSRLKLIEVYFDTEEELTEHAYYHINRVIADAPQD